MCGCTKFSATDTRAAIKALTLPKKFENSSAILSNRIFYCWVASSFFMMFLRAHTTEGASRETSIVSSTIFSSTRSSLYVAHCLNASFMHNTFIAQGAFADKILSIQLSRNFTFIFVVSDGSFSSSERSRRRLFSKGVD